MELERARMNSVTVEPTHHASNSLSARLGFVFTLFYLIFEFGRPQDRISLLGEIRLGLILTIVLIVLLFVNWQRLRTMASSQTTCMLLMLCLLALHVPFAQNMGRAFFATESIFLDTVMFISIVVFVGTMDRLRVFVKCWLFLMVYIAVNGILTEGSAGSSFLEDENDLALLMNMMLPFGIFLFFYERNKKIKLFYLIASLLGIACVIDTFSRGGFIGLLVVAFVVWLTSSRKVLLLGIAGGMALVISNLPITHPGTLVPGSTFWEEMTTITQEDIKDFNKESRVEYWKAGWEMFKGHPLGVGPQNFGVWLGNYRTDYFSELKIEPRHMWGKAAHSIWITLLAELGIPGALIFFYLLLGNVRDIRYLKNLSMDETNSKRYAYFLSLAFATSVVGFLTSGTFLSVLYYPHYWYITAMIVATRKIIDRGDSSSPEVDNRRVEFGKV
jgi:O-antigen ligase